jgi:GT2 family glycosyltransferase
VSDDRARLSVVVPTLGAARAERTADDLLASAAATATPIDLIVVWQAIAAPPAFPVGVRVLDVFPVGAAYARNRGLLAACAPLVAFVDDDEAVEPGWVAAVLATFDDHPDAAGVLGAVAPLVVDDDGIPYCEVSGDVERVFRRRSTPPWVVGTGGNMAFRRDALNAIGGFDVAMGPAAPGRSGEESDVMVRLLRSGQPLVWTPRAIVFHPTKTVGEHLASRRPYGHGTGAIARRRKDVGLAVRYTVAILQSWLTGLRTRDRQRRREALRTATGFLAGLARSDRARSPRAPLERMPAAVSAVVGDRTLRPLRARYTAQPEFRYAAGPLRLRIVPGSTATIDGADVLVQVVDRDALWVVDRPRASA